MRGGIWSCKSGEVVGVGGWNALVAAVKECESGVLAVKKWLAGGKLGTAMKHVTTMTNRFRVTRAVLFSPPSHHKAGERQPFKDAFERTLMPCSGSLR